MKVIDELIKEIIKELDLKTLIKKALSELEIKDLVKEVTAEIKEDIKDLMGD